VAAGRPARARILRSVRVVAAIGELPSVPAIYAMYGGGDRRHVAYVGIGDDLRRRVTQHLVNRNSSATTDTGAVRLHPDHISAVAWWEHPNFEDRVKLEAAELVAFDVLEPTMRSRGGITGEAKQQASDDGFRDEMASMFADAPTGRLELMTFAGLMKRLAALELRVDRLENDQT
jgi:hypothetical protein